MKKHSTNKIQQMINIAVPGDSEENNLFIFTAHATAFPVE